MAPTSIYHLMQLKLFNRSYEEPLVIAHRGASAYYPENTMAAFEAAVAMKADMIELDVLLSKEGVPVVFHDSKLDAHSNGKGQLQNFTLKELKKLDAGSWFDAEFSGQRIPTLEEVLEFASDTIALNIEIKTEAVSEQAANGVEEKVLRLVTNYGMQEHVLFSSFDYRAVKRLKEWAPGIPVAVLYEKKQFQKKMPSQLIKNCNADAFNCSYRQLNKRWIQDLKVHKIPFFIYTVDQKARMQKLLNMGAAGIFTNKPDVLYSLICSTG